MKNSMLKPRIARVVGSACAAFLLTGVFTSCSDDLLTGQPSWLGESIYDELKSRGNFTETLKLIEAQDEDYTSVLQKTGSKTLFVADDAAWAKFYQNNPWGVTSIEDMTTAQKSLLFKGNMINSAYLVELLGNLPSSSADADPQEGAVIRRATSVGIMDSVPLMKKADYPAENPARVDQTTKEVIDYWARVRGKDEIHILEDDEVASMIHFMPKFMQVNNISSADVEFLTNGGITSNDKAFVNGQVITESDITCQNGYIHVTEGVPVPLDNMANVIAQNPQFSIYKRLLDRFSYPYYDASINTEYHRQYGGEDSVFVRRYFNDHSGGGDFPKEVSEKRTVDGLVITNLLPYDPGWNRYRLASSSGITFQQDAAVMLVPTDEALLAYLDGEGIGIRDRYKSGSGATPWDNAPDNVILPLLKNTMLPSLKAAIPSQFASINNTASESMGVQKTDIDTVLWACNGIIYQTNKVYVAPEYVSVYYPCVILGDESLRYMYFYLDRDANATGKEGDNTVSIGRGYQKHLTNMGAKYSFIVPSDEALQHYYDPVSYKRQVNTQSTAVAYKFKMESGEMGADAYLVDWNTLDAKGRGTLGSQFSEPLTTDFKTGDVTNHLSDIVSSTFAPALFTPGQKFYQAQNGGPIIVEWSGNTVTGVAGSFQYERDYYIPVTAYYDMGEKGNGNSYIIDEEPLMSTFTSPYAALTDTLRQNQFGLFAGLLQASGQTLKESQGEVQFDGGVLQNTDGSHPTMDQALTLFNNYHYTIYVPQNDSIQALFDAHKLPTQNDLAEVRSCINRMDPDTEDSLRTYMKQQLQAMLDVVTNFVNYHIQDNSVYVEGEAHSNDVFETACLDTATTRFVKLYVTYTPGGDLTLTDNTGKTHKVMTSVTDDNGRKCYNVLTRQYYFASKSGGSVPDGLITKNTSSQATQIYSSSFAVLHLIDSPLVPFANTFYDADAYAKVQEIIADHPVGGTPASNPIKRRTR